MERNFGRFVGIVSKYTRLKHHDAQDVVQRALIKAWQKHLTCTGELDKWLVACCIHEGINYVRDARRYQQRLARAGHEKAIRPSTY